MPILNKNLIVTADDFGISPGVNEAIIKAHVDGALTNASLLANSSHLEAAIRLANDTTPGLKLGLHINLTGGKPLLPPSDVPNLVDKKGKFKHGPIGLLLQTIVKPSIINEIRNEIEAQIKKLKNLGVNIEHIDGHHHIQMIPKIFPIIEKFSNIYIIPRIRIVNEDLWHTITQTANIKFFINGGILRYALLKTFCYLNKHKTNTYFFSILNSCNITPELFKNIQIPKGFDNIEIMLHPGNPEIDTNSDIGDFDEVVHLTSPCREKELQTALFLKS